MGLAALSKNVVEVFFLSHDVSLTDPAATNAILECARAGGADTIAAMATAFLSIVREEPNLESRRLAALTTSFRTEAMRLLSYAAHLDPLGSDVFDFDALSAMFEPAFINTVMTQCASGGPRAHGQVPRGSCQRRSQ